MMFKIRNKEFSKDLLFKEMKYWIDLVINGIRFAMAKYPVSYFLIFQKELYELFLDYLSSNSFLRLKDIDVVNHEFIFVKKW